MLPLLNIKVGRSIFEYSTHKDMHMHIDAHNTKTFSRLVEGTPHQVFDVLGPTVEYLVAPDDPGAQFCVMRGVVPPGVTVPLHSHEDHEDFYFLDGTQQILIKDDHGLQWRDVHAGDYVHVPGGTPHAHRNVSDQPAIELVITTRQMGRFFQEIGRPIGGMVRPESPDVLAEFITAAARYGYTLATAEDNAAVGIHLPG
jgi:quercetin dioxygenase-like cupin family protein